IMSKLQILLTTFFTALVFSLQAQDTETRQIGGFTRIQNTGPFEVYLTKGNKPSIRVEARGIELEDVMTELTGGTLKVYPRKKTFSWGSYRNADVKVYVTYKELESISVHGSGNITAQTVISNDQIKLTTHGSGNILAEVKADELQLTVHGSGDLKISGKADKARAEVHGSGSIEALDLKASYLDANIHGSGEIEMNLGKEIEARIYGSGNVNYQGNPSRTNVKSHGSGKVRNVN
ncbi:MAG: head GIN domain-containing protein, partial [Bacteroidota bacterium]